MPLRGASRSGRILRRVALGRVGEVGEQREVQVRIAVGEEAHLEVVDAASRRARSVSMIAGTTTIVRSLGGNAAAQVELRQLPRRYMRVMSRLNRLIASSLTGSSATAATSDSSGQVAPLPRRIRHEAGQDERDAQRHRAQVAERRMAEHESRHPLAGGRWIAELRFEPEPAARNQVVADMVAAIVVRIGWRALARERHRAPRHVRLGLLRAACQLLDRMPVAIARREIHLRVGAGRIPAQDPLDHADLFEEHRPVDSTTAAACCVMMLPMAS